MMMMGKGDHSYLWHTLNKFIIYSIFIYIYFRNKVIYANVFLAWCCTIVTHKL